MGLFYVLMIIVGLLVLQGTAHFLSYHVLKNRTIKSRVWDLNICCGKTDGGGVNADVMKHADVANYVEISDINNLPFSDKQFKHTLTSHTIEHLDDPRHFFDELSRVSENVTMIVPPLWDVGSVINVFEHKWVFLTLRKTHTQLPRMIRLPGSRSIQRRMGQQIRA